MLTIRRSKDRGLAEHGWLTSRHTFSFAGYHDAAHMGFGALRVINEDRIAGGKGFSAHPHRDMEIISYVVSGALAHEDSLGNKTTIRPDEVQRMTAGTGVVHAEMNHEPGRETHFFQIWVIPARRGLAPGYGQKSFAGPLAAGEPVLVISPDGRDGSIPINQDATLSVMRWRDERPAAFPLAPGRRAWVQVIAGPVVVNGHELATGDAAAVTNEAQVTAKANPGAELLFFDLA